MSTHRNKARRHNPSKARIRAERTAAGTITAKPAPRKAADQRPSSWGRALLAGLSRKASFTGRGAHVWEGGGRKPDAKQERREARRLQRAQKRGA